MASSGADGLSGYDINRVISPAEYQSMQSVKFKSET